MSRRVYEYIYALNGQALLLLIVAKAERVFTYLCSIVCARLTARVLNEIGLEEKAIVMIPYWALLLPSQQWRQVEEKKNIIIDYLTTYQTAGWVCSNWESSRVREDGKYFVIENKCNSRWRIVFIVLFDAADFIW